MATNTPSSIPTAVRLVLGTYQLAIGAWFLYHDSATLFQSTTENLAPRLVSLALIGLSLSAGFLLLRNVLLGRTFTILHYLPQLLGVASPGFTFVAHHGISILATLAGTPRSAGSGTGTFSAGASANWNNTIDLAINSPHPNHPGYMLSLNILAGIIILLAVFCRQKGRQTAP